MTYYFMGYLGLKMNKEAQAEKWVDTSQMKSDESLSKQTVNVSEPKKICAEIRSSNRISFKKITEVERINVKRIY